MSCLFDCSFADFLRCLWRDVCHQHHETHFRFCYVDPDSSDLVLVLRLPNAECCVEVRRLDERWRRSASVENPTASGVDGRGSSWPSEHRDGYLPFADDVCGSNGGMFNMVMKYLLLTYCWYCWCRGVTDGYHKTIQCDALQYALLEYGSQRLD